jgi:hypothetical protein
VRQTAFATVFTRRPYLPFPHRAQQSSESHRARAQGPLKGLCFIPWRPHPGIALLVGRQDHRHGLGVDRLDHEPQVNRTYMEMAAHNGTGVLPARPRRPRDKAKVEVGVLDHGTLDSGAPAHSTIGGSIAWAS